MALAMKRLSLNKKGHTLSHKATAPGSIMLLGEHAVLHGYPAISAAINRTITVSIIPNESNTLSIESSLGEYECDINEITIKNPFTFLLACLKKQKLPSGCSIKIDSEFSDKVGLGSSAAITVATLKCLSDWLNTPLTKNQLLRQAIEIIHQVQGIGSGADCAASVYGGVVYYKMNPCIVDPLKHHPDISLVYTGYKTPTTDVIAKVAKAYEAHPSLYNTLYEKIGECTEHAKVCINAQDWDGLGHAFFQQQQLMDALGVSDNTINTIIDQALAEDGILGAKISGSGLGDCIVTLGKLPSHAFQSAPNGITPLSISIA